MSTGVVVTHAYRTAVGKSGKGTLRETRPDDLLGRLSAEVPGRLRGNFVRVEAKKVFSSWYCAHVSYRVIPFP